MKTLLAFIYTLFLSLSHGWIYKIDEWHKFDDHGNVVQKVYCLSDKHTDSGSKGRDLENTFDQLHRNAILSRADSLRKGNVLFIVEDTFSPIHNSHRKIAAFLREHNKRSSPDRYAENDDSRGLLSSLVDTLNWRKHDAINVECRQQRIISDTFYHTLDAIRKSDPDMFSAVYGLISNYYAPTLPEIAQDFKDALAQVRHYATTDGAALADYYVKRSEQLEKTLPYADLLSTRDYYHWNCLDAAHNDLRGFAADAFKLWGSELVDANALHALYNAPDRKKVCIIMGGMHVYGISKQLPLLGYRKMRTVGNDPLTKREWKQYESLFAEIYNVTQLVPKKLDVRSRKRVGNDILADNRVIDTKKENKFKAIATKFYLVPIGRNRPVDDSAFDILSDKTSSDERSCS